MTDGNAKRLVFISQWGCNLKGVNGGNVKKVLSQIENFKGKGYEVKKVIREIPHYTDSPTLLERVISKSKNFLPFCTNEAKISYSEVGESDYYYIRFRAYDFFFRKLLKDIKRYNPDAKIVLEYSDYPYIEYKGKDPIGDYLVKKRDEYEKKKCSRYIDRIATLLPDKYIDGIKCLRIRNGLNVTNIKTRIPRIPDGRINVIIVASLQRSHGVDLFIEGMKKYYQNEYKEEIYLHIVGGGEIVQELKIMSKQIEDKVIFYGYKYGEELDEIYNRCDIGIEFLAPKRKNITISASLKSREYIARGLPFVSACRLDVSDIGFSDYLKIDDSEQPINMNEIIKYYHSLSNDLKKIEEMRTFAEMYLDMDYAMKEVTDYFQEHEK